LSKKLDKALLEKFPRLEKFVDDIIAIDTIRNYLNERLKLIDVGTAPKLVIRGEPHATGIQKT
jgi:hypothetical protein